MNFPPRHFPARFYWRCFRLRGLLWYVRAIWLRRAAEVHVRPPHCRTPLTLRLRTSDLAFYQQLILQNPYTLPWRHPPRVIIDAGANIGLASVRLANQFPQARILALEPEDSNFNMLRKNTAAYPLITPIHAALWSSTATLDILNPTGRHGTFRTQPPPAPDGMRVLGQTAAVSVPHLLAEHQLDGVDLLKVDIEGAEKEVFADPAVWIGRVGVIIAELHDRFQRGCALNFYRATQSFDLEWHRGEHVIVARKEVLAPPSLPSGLSGHGT